MVDHVTFNDTFKKEIERVVSVRGATPTRVTERFVASPKLPALIGAYFLNNSTMPRVILDQGFQCFFGVGLSLKHVAY